jgi:hypothetical protein
MKSVAVAVLALVTLLPSTTAQAAALPPPPPPPSGCESCNPPPPPPTPVPTVAPTAVPAQPVVDVHVASSKVPRGQTQEVSIDASTNDSVSVTIQFKSGKPISYRTKIGSSGMVVKKFTIPRSAPIGKAQIRISVKGAASYSKTIDFLVTK